MSFIQTDLPYAPDALAPAISKLTVELHHGKYYNDYLTKLNNLVEGTPFAKLDLETIIRVADGPVFYNAAQVWNHTFYFESLTPGRKNSLSASLRSIINKSFGSVSFFKRSFIKEVNSFCGVGWIWLVMNEKGLLEIIPKSNAGNPLRLGYVPLLVCDLWEHSYYLDYQNRCLDYFESFWKLINWQIVEKRLTEAIII
jgi:superoxide dismutase, Fe-Mn family